MIIYGHRGARGEAPENTLAAFRRAVHTGATAVELDLRLSRDRQLMVIHDDTVQRTTGKRGSVARLDAASMARLDARHKTPPCATPQPIPTIAQVLNECPEISHFQLEAKAPQTALFAATVQQLAALFVDQALYSRATVTSFDARLLAALRAVDANVALGLVTDSWRPDPIALARTLGAGLLVLNWKIATAARIEAAHRAGLQVSAWTVNDEAVVRRLYAAGIDSIVTDYPGQMVPLARSLAMQ